MKKILLTTAAVISAGIVAQAQTTGTPPGFALPVVNNSPQDVYGHIDDSGSTYTTTSVGQDSLTLGLDATPHFSALANNPPAVTALGTGKYGVSTGVGPDLRSVWNYDFGVSSTLGALSDYTFSLTVKNEGNGQTASYNPAPALPGVGITDDNGIPGSSFGNSESLDFTLSTPLFFGSIGYNPALDDTYDFTLTASTRAGGVVASDSITVVAGAGADVPDSASTMALMSASLAGLGFMSRRFRK